jgi:hypothetical protein
VPPDVDVVAVQRDGQALARVRRGAGAVTCHGDDTQLVWTRVAVEELP